MKQDDFSVPEQIKLLADTMGHPLRGKLLFATTEKTGRGAKELAERIGEPIGKVRYHLRALVKLGLIVVAEEATRRGVVEHRYRSVRPPAIGPDEDVHLSEEQKRKLSFEIIKCIFADATVSIERETMWERHDRALARCSSEVDASGWKELAEIHERALRETREVMAQGAERLRSGGGIPIQATSAILLFELPVWEP